jgi:hypothetical protein
METRERPRQEAFRAGDVYIDYPYEDVKFRFEKETGKVCNHPRRVLPRLDGEEQAMKEAKELCAEMEEIGFKYSD